MSDLSITKVGTSKRAGSSGGTASRGADRVRRYSESGIHRQLDRPWYVSRRVVFTRNSDIYLEFVALGSFVGFHGPQVSIVDLLEDEQLVWATEDATIAKSRLLRGYSDRPNRVEEAITLLLQVSSRTSLHGT